MTGSPRPVGPRSLAQRREAARVPDGLADVGRVLLLVPDPHARFAGVELDGRFFADGVVTGGYGVCSYVFVWDVHRDVPATLDESLRRYADRFGDLRMRPDFATLTPVPDALAVVCDVEWPDGSAVDIAPRTVLTRQLAALEERGLVPSIGIEHEVTFRGPDGEPLTTQPVDYALGGTERLRPVLRTAAALLDRAGLGVESARAECHPGQYEIVLRHRDALAACDDALLQQFLVRHAAAGHGVTAGYLAAEQTGRGSSGHVHLSLSTMDGQPVERRRLNSFLAGVLREARALTPIWAPTWNSYVRLRTGPFSPRVLRWGTDDRTASVRVAGGDEPRLEFRFAGADAQPHLVVAALLAAGMTGLDEDLEPPPEGESCGELAGSPWEALAGISGLLGPEVTAQQTSLLRAEIDAGLESVSDWQRDRARSRS
ncbi:glutamine synthetase family protein [Amycolatopsis sp. 195334CR]|uniref:glutamine synthetase family protein n=1 Tax=Amycolatopsis sp. 195334CR TaxID=2814588 RepID=UPI001A8D3F38|nr:glutamine synthetase family protein [Amycolatopsis sp. 195334CR]MBN6038834.1 glutamine synthetase [Amycolatopsis sp. 195334CR]